MEDGSSPLNWLLEKYLLATFFKGVQIGQTRLPTAKQGTQHRLSAAPFCLKRMMRGSQEKHDTAAGTAAPTSAHACSSTQAAQIIHPLKARQVADGGWQLPSELIGIQTPACHVGKGV